MSSLPLIRSIRTVLAVVLIVPAFLVGAPVGSTAETEWTPLLDIRVRQEVFDGVYHFAPEPDRNWIRVRTRLGGRVETGAHHFELRLANEHRYFITPDLEPDWDEWIVDQVLWAWQFTETTKLVLGRQNIIWPGGFLMLEGHPLDGSRSIYHNAVRLQSAPDWGRLDLAAIYQPKYDELVIGADERRALTDMDELGGALRVVRGPWAGHLIYKYETDPDEVLEDLTTVTASLRHDGKLGKKGNWHLDLAGQLQEGPVTVAADDRRACGTGWAWAGEGLLGGPIGKGWTAELDGFYYSGLGNGLRPFRPPWGRWPKWSEMYIYSLIGESTPGRVHVAAWEDVSGFGGSLKRGLFKGVGARLNARYLLSSSYGEGRGLLTQAELQFELGYGFRGHVLWEALVPGSFHDGRHGLPPITSTIHFLRWEIFWAL